MPWPMKAGATSTYVDPVPPATSAMTWFSAPAKGFATPANGWEGSNSKGYPVKTTLAVGDLDFDGHHDFQARCEAAEFC